MTMKFEDYWRNRSLVYETERGLAFDAFEFGFKSGMERAAEIARNHITNTTGITKDEAILAEIEVINERI